MSGEMSKQAVEFLQNINNDKGAAEAKQKAIEQRNAHIKTLQEFVLLQSMPSFKAVTDSLVKWANEVNPSLPDGQKFQFANTANVDSHKLISWAGKECLIKFIEEGVNRKMSLEFEVQKRNHGSFILNATAEEKPTLHISWFYSSTQSRLSPENIADMAWKFFQTGQCNLK